MGFFKHMINKTGGFFKKITIDPVIDISKGMYHVVAKPVVNKLVKPTYNKVIRPVANTVINESK